MSGGRFDFSEFRIDGIAEQIMQEVIISGKPIPKQRWDYSEHQEFAETGKAPMNYAYPDSVLRRMEEAVYALKRAFIYSHRIDYLLSGDDGEENFERRLSDELAELDAKSKMGDNGVMYYKIDRSKDPYDDD